MNSAWCPRHGRSRTSRVLRSAVLHVAARPMTAILAWLDYTERDRKQAIGVVGLLREPSTVDELGVDVVSSCPPGDLRRSLISAAMSSSLAGSRSWRRVSGVGLDPL